ncbi:B3 domain-containing transcription factor ABI3-like isoform X2 [Henckelia pumila]|uniref:B3 domain-containing transcription factor ABI3-like isoform X2 n=1 Tax=Henckelia pumila TaxID=405737 RepID=UPI003C6DE448
MIEEGGGGGGSPVADRDRRSSGRNCGEDYGGGMEVEEQGVVVMEEKDFWFEKEQENTTLLDMNDASVLFGDFPSLPELPCMSSSSSSSTAPAAGRNIAATPSSSSAASSSPEASWAVPKRKRSQNEAGYAVVSASTTATDIAATPSDLEGTLDADCVHMMENLGYMDLIDSNELWDPSSLFESQETIPGQEAPPPHKAQCQEENDGFSFLRGNKELSMIFLDWLKQNKDHISAEDVRKIKLNRSTIENASKRLGRTKEGMKRLLKLILEWVEQHQLQKNGGGGRPQSHYQYQENPGVNPTLVPNSSFSYINVVSPDNSNQRCFPTASCMIPVPMPQVLESATLVAATPGLPPPPAVGYCNMGGATYSNPPLPVPPAYHHHQQVMNMMPCTAPSSEYQMMNNAQAWTPAPYTVSMSPQFSHSRDNSHPVSSYQQVFVGNPYQTSAPNGENLVRSGCSATREARKNRMARQKRLYSNHHRHKNQIDCSHPIGDPVSSPEDWVYSPVTDSASTPPTDSVPIPPVDASQPSEDQVKQGSMQLQDFRPESYSDQLQNGCSKTERNLKFLMQKVLKQSDVGNLGRIVLPKEAENHLPELGTRDGVTIAMEDIGASRVWNMRYRFWPNNKSRMYLLENTGDFVKVNGLQEGDFIVIYLDTKCGKYMIRGVKVRPPEAKPEKPTGRRNARNLSRPHIRSSPGPAVT